MSATYRIERDRGIKEYRDQLAELRKKWPLAFPAQDEDVRPLAVDATDEIAAVMGWSYPYTLGVLSRWKMAPVYCQAVLCHHQPGQRVEVNTALSAVGRESPAGIAGPRRRACGGA